MSRTVSKFLLYGGLLVLTASFSARSQTADLPVTESDAALAQRFMECGNFYAFLPAIAKATDTEGDLSNITRLRNISTTAAVALIGEQAVKAEAAALQEKFLAGFKAASTAGDEGVTIFLEGHTERCVQLMETRLELVRPKVDAYLASKKAQGK